MLPQFLSSGKYEYVMKFHGKFYFHKAIVHFREEAIAVRTLSKTEDEELL
jgi:hypothetical protein